MAVTPTSATLRASQTQQFKATVTGTSNTAVTWSLNPVVGTITSAGFYTAPASISSSQNVTVIATSAANSSETATATVNLQPTVSVAVSPTSAALRASQTQQFKAIVTGTSNTAVTWSLNPFVGTITSAGLYTAPTSISSSQNVNVIAASAADSTKTASAAVSLQPTVSIAVSPTSATLRASQTQQFKATVTGTSNATVTWSLNPVVGTITSAGVYTAPASISSSQNVNVIAASAADSTKTATAALSLQPTVSIAVSPTSATLRASQTQQFKATVTGTTNTAVTWSLNPVLGTITSTGLYTAPASITSSQTVTVIASSAADSSKTETATVSLQPSVSVVVSPTGATLRASQTQQFKATVTGTMNAAVTWSLIPAVGTISSSGVYTAPASIASAQKITVKATSTADPTKSASATISLTPVTVTLTPSTASLTISQSQQFTPTVTGTANTGVTWSLSPVVGTISGSGLYTAPASIASAQNVMLTATSIVDPTKSASATISLTPVAVALTPSTSSLTVLQTQQFTATVTGSSNTAVTWSLSPAVGTISSTGVYTAPASITSTQNVTLTATSTADPTKSAIATISLNPPVTVTVGPSNVAVYASWSQQFGTTVTGTSNTAVTWSLAPTVGTISSTGVYTAPASITSTQNVTLTATSTADPTKSAIATISLNPPVTVTVGPSNVALYASSSQQFGTTVTGTSNTAITWSLSPAVGTISSTGVYTAPASITSAQNVTVTAASTAEPSQSASALVYLQPSPLSQNGPIVWAVGSLYRVGPADAAGTSTTAQMWAGRGEYESFQIITQAPTGGLTNVNVTVSDLISAGGQTIAKSNISLFREQYVLVLPSSPDLGGSNQPLGAGWYPDGLIPFVDPSTGLPATGGTIQAVPFSISAGQNQPIWVDVSVPITAVSGQYYGTYTVTSNQGSFTGQIILTVWNFTLPLQPSLRSSLSFWTADSLQAEEELARNKLAPLLVPPGNQPVLINNFGLGQTDLGYYSGTWYGQFFSGAYYGNCTMSPAPSVTELQAAVAIQQPGLYLYNYTADEIDACTNLYPTLQQWAYNLHQAGLDNLVTMTPVPQLYDDGSGSGRSAVDIWTLLPNMYNAAVSNVQYVLAKGDKVWSYNAQVQDTYSPKWEIDFAPINFRIQPGFISQSLGLSGLLYWRVDDWSSDPWNEVNNTGQFGSNNYPGEGMLVYPGSTVGIQGVAPSMRLKWLRDGVEDYEYVELLKTQGYGFWALGVAAIVGPDWTNWARDPAALESARIQLGQQLDAIFSAASAPAN